MGKHEIPSPSGEPRATTVSPGSDSAETAMVHLTRGELEAVIIGTEASRLKPLLRPARWEDACNAEKKLFAALREKGWNR